MKLVIFFLFCLFNFVLTQNNNYNTEYDKILNFQNNITTSVIKKNFYVYNMFNYCENKNFEDDCTVFFRYLSRVIHFYTKSRQPKNIINIFKKLMQNKNIIQMSNFVENYLTIIDTIKENSMYLYKDIKEPEIIIFYTIDILEKNFIYILEPVVYELFEDFFLNFYIWSDIEEDNYIFYKKIINFYKNFKLEYPSNKLVDNTVLYLYNIMLNNPKIIANKNLIDKIFYEYYYKHFSYAENFVKKNKHIELDKILDFQKIYKTIKIKNYILHFFYYQKQPNSFKDKIIEECIANLELILNNNNILKIFEINFYIYDNMFEYIIEYGFENEKYGLIKNNNNVLDVYMYKDNINEITYIPILFKKLYLHDYMNYNTGEIPVWFINSFSKALSEYNKDCIKMKNFNFQNITYKNYLLNENEIDTRIYNVVRKDMDLLFIFLKNKKIDYNFLNNYNFSLNMCFEDSYKDFSINFDEKKLFTFSNTLILNIEYDNYYVEFSNKNLRFSFKNQLLEKSTSYYIENFISSVKSYILNFFIQEHIFLKQEEKMINIYNHNFELLNFYDMNIFINFFEFMLKNDFVFYSKYFIKDTNNSIDNFKKIIIKEGIKRLMCVKNILFVLSPSSRYKYYDFIYNNMFNSNRIILDNNINLEEKINDKKNLRDIILFLNYNFETKNIIVKKQTYNSILCKKFNDTDLNNVTTEISKNNFDEDELLKEIENFENMNKNLTKNNYDNVMDKILKEILLIKDNNKNLLNLKNSFENNLNNINEKILENIIKINNTAFSEFKTLNKNITDISLNNEKIFSKLDLDKNAVIDTITNNIIEFKKSINNTLKDFNNQNIIINLISNLKDDILKKINTDIDLENFLKLKKDLYELNKNSNNLTIDVILKLKNDFNDALNKTNKNFDNILNKNNKEFSNNLISTLKNDLDKLNKKILNDTILNLKKDLEHTLYDIDINNKKNLNNTILNFKKDLNKINNDLLNNLITNLKNDMEKNNNDLTKTLFSKIKFDIDNINKTLSKTYKLNSDLYNSSNKDLILNIKKDLLIDIDKNINNINLNLKSYIEKIKIELQESEKKTILESILNLKKDFNNTLQTNIIKLMSELNLDEFINKINFILEDQFSKTKSDLIGVSVEIFKKNKIRFESIEENIFKFIKLQTDINEEFKDIFKILNNTNFDILNKLKNNNNIFENFNKTQNNNIELLKNNIEVLKDNIFDFFKNFNKTQNNNIELLKNNIEVLKNNITEALKQNQKDFVNKDIIEILKNNVKIENNNNIIYKNILDGFKKDFKTLLKNQFIINNTIYAYEEKNQNTNKNILKLNKTLINIFDKKNLTQETKNNYNKIIDHINYLNEKIDIEIHNNLMNNIFLICICIFLIFIIGIVLYLFYSYV